jgi:plastocyanin
MKSFAVAAVVVVGLLAACGESEPIDFGLPEGAARIDQRSLRFQPDELTVDALESVYFTNSETALHTVTIDGENESGEMERGDVFSFAFPESGEYEITCDYHPQMRATITVR